MKPRDSAAAQRSTRLIFLRRAAIYLLLWIVLIGTKPTDLVFGAITAMLATWVSLRLLPPGMLRIRPFGALRLLPRFLWQSIFAGVDVARRAFDPRLPIAPGFVVFRPQSPPGAARNAFTAYTSLLPGTVPCGLSDGAVVYHCLDVGQPVAEQLAAEEARFAQAVAPESETADG
jgi:multicomponent Na+:H+ antiporter subunit E